MGKVADRYLEIDPWRVRELGFHADRSRQSESLFSLANEHQGVRGYFEEGYSGDRLVGTYVSGLFEEHLLAEPVAYKGISNRVCFVVNTVDWLYARLEVDGERLDLATSAVDDFRRDLDFRTGELTRSFAWTTRSGRHLEVTFRRFLSLATNELAMQRISLTALDFSGPVTLTLGLDFSPIHETYRRNYWRCPTRAQTERGAAITGVTANLGYKLFAGFSIRPELAAAAERIDEERFVGLRFRVDLAEGVRTDIDRSVVLSTTRNATTSVRDEWTLGMERLRAVESAGYDEALAESAACWQRFWEQSDVVIEGDPETQQGIRYCLFQLHQSYRGAVPGSNIGAKGLTGEAYNGNAFWDTETYCLPFYLFSDPAAARSLIDFRHATLPQALERARDLDCEGAAYPIATCDGTESCTLWQHASLQLQPTTAVAYAVAHYARITGDTAFLHGEGAELLVQVCRFLATRGQWSARRRTFGYYAVMGPDEFQMMVNNNAYTNYMAKRTFEYAIAVLDEMASAAPDAHASLLDRLACTPDEIDAWRSMAERMFIPYDPETGLIEQHEGFFDLPHIDVDAIPVEDFPLYHHWSYDRIYRNDMIKQPDVLMFLFLYNRSFSLRDKRANYDYYEPRCIHESSLSPSVHSILAAELGRPDEAFEFFRFATRIDLDDYNRNVREGIHMTSIAAAWMNIVYGFGGFRSDGDTLVFAPTIPPAWTRYAFRLRYRDSLISVDVTPERAVLSTLEGSPVPAIVNGCLTEIGGDGITVPISVEIGGDGITVPIEPRA